DGIDWAPGNSPPSCHESKQRPRESFDRFAFVGPDEIDVRAAFEGHDENGNAILVLHESCPALEFICQLLRIHSLNTYDFCHIWTSSFGSFHEVRMKGCLTL